MTTRELSDEEIERIHEEAYEAAEMAAGPYTGSENPYPAGSEEAEIWSFAYRQALANDWH